MKCTHGTTYKTNMYYVLQNIRILTLQQQERYIPFEMIHEREISTPLCATLQHDINGNVIKASGNGFDAHENINMRTFF